MPIHEVLSWASLFLRTNDCDESAALLLLEHHLDWDRSKIYAHLQDPMPKRAEQSFRKDIEAHVHTGIPVQHLMGSTEFYGRTFNVNGNVLVPRFETEELVEEALRVMEERAGQITSVVDLGTGSGVIATSIACEQKDVTVYATDISEEALQVAQENMKIHDAPVTCFQGDFAQPLIDRKLRVQMIISNPPYIAYREREELSKTVREFDPSLALFAENEGLATYETIIEQATYILDTNGVLLFEIGAEQGSAVKRLIKDTFPTSEVAILQDINGKDRIVRAYV